MEQLLSIKRIPIKIEVNVTNAQLKPIENPAPNSTPAVKVSRNAEGVTLAAQPCKVDVSAPKQDSYTPSPVPTSGVTLTYDAYAKLPGQEGSQQPAAGKPVAPQSSQSIEAILNKLPKTKRSGVSYNDGTLSINYSMVSSGKDQDIGSISDLKNGFEFIPGDIEFIVSQMPGLEIEYVGDPLYFPRSADPNYKGEVDVIA